MKCDMKFLCHTVWWALLIFFPSMTISSSSDSSSVTSIKVSPTPVLNSNITITCTVTGLWQTIVNVYKSPTPNFSKIVSACLPNLCSVPVAGNTEFTTDESHVYIKITNLTRADDGKYWSCQQFGMHQYILLTVYTLPQSISFESPFEQERSLAVEDVTLVCKTDECTYNQPLFTWHYKKLTETTALQNFTSVVSTEDELTQGCKEPEKIYRSTLRLKQNTTASGNEDLIAKFQCKLSFPKISFNKTTEFTPAISFAVQVTKVTLKQGSLTPIQNLTVTANVPISLKCIPGTSRPPPIISWYIGTSERESSHRTTYNFTASNTDHRKQIFCKAYNLKKTVDVQSAKPVLYVIVPVARVTIKQLSNGPTTGDKFTVTQDESASFTCTAEGSRPEPVFKWYINATEQSTGSTYSFTPDNSQHNAKIYCTAHNIRTESSEKRLLYVQVKAAPPDMLNGTDHNITFLDGDSYSLVCRSSETRPASHVTWKIGSLDVTSNIKQHVYESDELFSVVSTLVFTASTSEHRLQITCMSKIPTQVDSPSKSKTIIIWWAPAVPQVIPVSRPFPWLEGQTGVMNCSSSDFGNPNALVVWLTQIASATIQNHLEIANLTYEFDKKSVRCKLQNQFTSLKKPVESAQILLDIQYIPRVTIKVDDIIASDLTVVEGSSEDIYCIAVGNPTPSVSWSGPHITQDNRLSFVNINRSQAANYICRAEAHSLSYQHIEFTTEASITVTVQFPPDVRIELTGNITENQSLTLTCIPEGVPDQYNYHSWIQVWRQKSIKSNPVLTNLPEINLPSLQLQDSGNYTCSADNNISSKDGELKKFGTAEVRVQVPPKIFVSETMFAGKFSENISISFPFYAHPTYESVVMKKNNSVIKNSTKHLLWSKEAEVATKFFDERVYLIGQNLSFTVVGLDEDDFTDYHLYIANGISSTALLFSISSESKPQQPTNFQLLSIRGASAVFIWTRGFNGGPEQTFIIQFANEGSENWSTEMSVHENDNLSNLGNRSYLANITDLKPGSYNVRLVAVNANGESDPVKLSSTIYISSIEEATPEPFPVAVVAGCSVGGVVLAIIAVTSFVIWTRRTKSNKDDSRRSVLLPERRQNIADSADNAEVNINPMYESADTDQLPLDNEVYAEVNKQTKQKKHGALSDVYAKVQKQEVDTSSKQTVVPDIYSTPVKKAKGKEKKEKKKTQKKFPSEKLTKGSAYENAKFTKNETKDMDNVYENPAFSAPETLPKRTRNEDGLIYIDVELPKQKESRDLKPVIHGEDRTIYADVAYGQVGEQMPESDEETPKES